MTVTFGTDADIDLLRPFWLALHRIHQQADPELAPHVDDETSWRRRRGSTSTASRAPTRSCCWCAATAT